MSEPTTESLHKDNKEAPDSNYWKSFKELFNDSKLAESRHLEFGAGVKENFEPSKLSAISRRKFLALAGASAALAGAGCSDYRHAGNIIPYNKMPEEITVGNANYYASTSTACSNGCGILIKTREGRPIKVDGNPDHPVSQGKTCAKCQASILNLYDPERLQFPVKRSGSDFVQTTWNDAGNVIIRALNNSGNKQIAIISHTVISPTGKRVLDDFVKKYPNTKVYSYELFNEESRNSAWKKCYGTDTFPLIKWNEAKIILGLETDFLGTDGNKVETTRLFAEGRNFNETDKFNRLYIVEGGMSVTGMNADYRFRLRPDALYEFVLGLLSELDRKGVDIPAGGQVFGGHTLAALADKYSLSRKKLKLLVKDLIDNKGKSIVYAGRTLPENVHIAVNLLNDALGNYRLYRNDSSSFQVLPLSKKDDFNGLLNEINNGNVDVVIHYDSNPAYHLPDDLNYAESLEKVPLVVSLTGSQNDSSVLGHFTLPINHDFEAWGDAKTRTGFYSLQQPVIDPIFDTRQKEAVVLTWINGESSYNSQLYYNYVVDNWKQNIYPSIKTKLNFTELWNAGLHDGVVITKEIAPGSGSFNKSAADELPKSTSIASRFVITLKESYQSGDGRFLNNGWLQELPHPVTKITWDNYAAISNLTAKTLGVDDGDLIVINSGKRTLEIPVVIQPGADDNTISIELGYGRKVVGIVGTGVGFDSSVLMSQNYIETPWIIKAETVKKGSGSYALAATMEHHLYDNELTKDIPKKRKIIQEGTVTGYIKNNAFLHPEKEEEKVSLYPEHPYPEVKWGMVVDLNKCIGCGDCVIACNAENNIPVVGKDQVLVGREMQWLRVDRYYSGDVDEPAISNQIMLCQHCDNAPCENVCPVAATTHSPDGLNQMTYNRCVGTRYCSNNCPYKVRRFNYYNFRDHYKDAYQQSTLLSLVYNPEVTVRSRGVMEKCSFCVQRIMDARSGAIAEHKEFKGSDVKTACQEACNTYAIKFGDSNDKSSEIHKYRNHELAYYVLEDVNTRPNVTYLAKLRNTETEES
ncbi:MAG: 4Fe-4S dicluster domain-containing protein [Ignavibacteriaceae bacterium]|jgi:molybdopterin-containing oxidoreductase family iron-sulfur binding subunit